MTNKPREELRALAIAPTCRGLGFVVMEGSTRLVDWGVRSARTEKQLRASNHLAQLITTYQPDYLVVERVHSTGSRRCERIKKLLSRLVLLGAEMGVRVRRVSKSEVKEAFAPHGAETKNQIALEIGRQFPELAPKVPPYRKPWMSEDYQMPVFDAVAMAVAFNTPLFRHDANEIA